MKIKTHILYDFGNMPYRIVIPFNIFLKDTKMSIFTRSKKGAWEKNCNYIVEYKFISF
jgi:hypothetical protein